MDNIIINLDDGLRLGGDPLPNIASPSDIISQSDTIVGPQGPAGPAGPAGRDGEAATITVGSTTTGAAGTNAVVQNSGTSSAAILDFTIPRGDKGETGATGATGATGPAGADGEAATITVGSVTTVSSEYPATVTNSGTSSAAVLDFQIPQGIQGETGATGPQGPAGADGRDGIDGRDGADGQAATITVGSTTTGAAGTNASVTNSGTSSAAVLEFTIPRGDTGATGPQGPAGTTDWNGITNKPTVESVTLTRETQDIGWDANTFCKKLANIVIVNINIGTNNTFNGVMYSGLPVPSSTITFALNGGNGTAYRATIQTDGKMYSDGNIDGGAWINGQAVYFI